MGGRGSGGGPGPGSGKSGKASAAKKPGAGGGSAGGSGGSGGSAGSSKSAGKGNAGAGTGGIDGGKGSPGGQAGGGSTPKPVDTDTKITYSDNENDLEDWEREEQEAKMAEMPLHLRRRLALTGLKTYVGSRADETPGWYDFMIDRGITPDTKIADGRPYGTLSFYAPDRREIYISVHNPGGSVNVYVHEMAHAVDNQWTNDDKWISADPDWVALHTKYVLNNPLIIAYYRGGPSGTNAVSGRKELFAEGFAVFNRGGRDALVKWVHSAEAADEMIKIWKKYGVVK
ncbi:metalloprotease [Mycobacterium phage BogosyJay]|nr:metalloprotease [Mycobacterium phage Maminiaina]QFG14912.1 metalloprotease [Mycobacterium phage BogosyJay]